MNAPVLSGPAAVTPGLHVPDPYAAYWLAQVHIRLRREINWCWHQRLGRNDPRDGSLPAITEASAEVLDWIRFADEKRRFLSEDPAGNYLGACLQQLVRPQDGRGAWAFATAALSLDDAAQFLLGLGVARHLDAGLGPVFAVCANDLARPFPTAALAQRLWDDPAAIARSLVDDHPLFRSGLVRSSEEAAAWQRPLQVPATVANALAGLADPHATRASPVADSRLHQLDEALETLRQQLARRVPERLEIVPLRGPIGADFPGWAAALTAAGPRPLWPVAEAVAADAEALTERSTLAWLAGADLLLPESPTQRPLDPAALRCLDHAVRWFVPVHGAAALANLPSGVCRPEAVLPPLGYDQRLALLLDGLGVAQEALRDAAAECARRFRLEAPAVRRLTDDLRGVPGLDAAQLAAACRGAVEGRHDDATQHVTPRLRAQSSFCRRPRCGNSARSGRPCAR